MQLLIASGESKNSEAWAHEVSAKLGPLYDSTRVLPYAHWEHANGSTNVLAESQCLHELAAQTSEDYAVFAKSIGTLVTLRALSRGLITPAYCVFVGLPFNWTKHEYSVAGWLKDYNTPTLFIQQTDDPGIGYDELEAVLEERNVTNRTMVEVPGNDHKYADVDDLKNLVADYITRQANL